MHDVELTQYEKYVLTEALRLHEERNGDLEDSSAVAVARQAKPEPEARLVARAMCLVREHGLLTSTANWGGWLSMGRAIVIVVSAVTGVFIGLSILASAPSPINAPNLVGLLLIAQMAGLLMWIASFRVQLSGGWSLFPSIEKGVEHFRKSKGFDVLRLQAQAILDQQNDLSRWRLGLLIHSGWIVFFVAMLITVLWGFSFKHIDFVVESTILPDSFFVSMVNALGALPSQFGFPVPSDLDIRNALDRVNGDHHARRAWGWWIIGVLSIWALLPRVLVWALCRVVVNRKEESASLNLDNPYYAGKRRLLFPHHNRSVVVDPDRSSQTRSAPVKSGKQMTGRPVVIGLNMTEAPWLNTLPESILDGGLVQDSADEERVRKLLDGEHPARLLIVCNASISTDRASRRQIADFAARAGMTGVLLVRFRDDGDDVRLSLWQDEIPKCGIEECNVFTSQGDALRWLQTY